MKSGFGLIEVIAAAVVLAFMLIGLNTLQKGNRESILRVRARDVANVVAQDIIDSISALGSASIAEGERKCPDDYDEEHDLCRTHTFTGSVSRMLKDTMKVKVPYSVTVEVRQPDALQIADEPTDYMKEAAAAGGNSGLDVRHQLAKQVDVTVNWKFKNSEQSINVSAIVR